MTNFTLDLSDNGVVVREFEGFGAQYNQKVLPPIKADGVTEENLRVMKQRLGLLRPQFVRVFFSGEALQKGNGDLKDSFVETVKLAQSTAATINVTFQGIGAKKYRHAMPAFAEVLAELVEAKKISKLKWVTIRNEPNRPPIDRDVYQALYKELHDELVERGVRSQIRFMGGDLLEEAKSVDNNQTVWLKFLATKKMSDLLDAFSIHVYWSYGDTAKLERRLTDTLEVWSGLPREFRKPLYITEYGVRGDKIDQRKPNPGFFKTKERPLGETNINAFQHAWFFLKAAQLGYHGIVKWDAYFGRYGASVAEQEMAFQLIGRPPEWRPSPTFHLMRLLTTAVSPGSRVVKVAPADETALVVGFVSPSGRLSAVGLDKEGGSLNTKSSLPDRLYRLGVFPRNTQFRLRYWNHFGKGQFSPARIVSSDASGIVSITAPVHSVFSITSTDVP